MDIQSRVLLCQEIESDLRDLCLECRKKSPIIKDYTERAILKIRHHRDLVEQHGDIPVFPLDEVLRSILMACENYQNNLVMISLSCLQRLIHRRVLKEETVAIVINLMKEQAINGDEAVQLRVLQTIMLTPSHMTLMNEAVVEQLLQLLYVLHNSTSVSVHHTACAGLRQLAEYLTDRAVAALDGHDKIDLSSVSPVIQHSQGAMPVVMPTQPSGALPGPLRIMYVFVQDLCVMADYDATSFSSRYSLDAGERMRTGFREGFWLAQIKFPRPLCLELLGTCVAVHPQIFVTVPECFVLLRHCVCAVLLKNLRGCHDFAIMIRSIQLLQQILNCQTLATQLLPELQVFLQLMLDLTQVERSLWQRATSLEFLKSLCEDKASLALLYGGSTDGPRLFVELVNSLSKLIHQICFSSGPDTSCSPQRGGQLDRSNSGLGVGGGAPNSGMALLSTGTLPNFNLTSAGSNGLASAGSGRVLTGGAARNSARLNLLHLMSEAEPPAVQPSLIVSMVVECLFSVVSTLYGLLREAGEAPINDDCTECLGNGPLVIKVGAPVHCRPLTDPMTEAQLRCRGMLADSWASLLSALSLLLHRSVDDRFLQQTLQCLQTLLYSCGRMGLEQARDACLLQLSRYALPGQNHETEFDALGGGMTPKNVWCFKALLNICHCFGVLLCVSGWTLALRAFDGLERSMRGLAPGQRNEVNVLRQALDALFESTVCLPAEALVDMVTAMSDHLKSLGEGVEAQRVINRLTELCISNSERLLVIWEAVLGIFLHLCESSHSMELRGGAANALCRILAQALRKRLAPANSESTQAELLRPIATLIQSQQDGVRMRVCEGLLEILQASGQELESAAWVKTVELVALAAQVELRRAGFEFLLPQRMDPFSPASQPSNMANDSRDLSSVLPVVHQLVQLLVHDFMELVPMAAVQQLTASIGAFARFTGLGVNSSLTAIGFLWNVADALARHTKVTDNSSDTISIARVGAGVSSDLDELWIQIFMHLRVLAVDARPEVRNCAVKSLTSALLSHGQKIGTLCYRRCLQEIQLPVLVEIRAATRSARAADMSACPQASEGLIVHHSRDTLEKQWNETMVLGVDGVRRVLSHFVEEAGVVRSSPLVYKFLLHVRDLLDDFSTEVSGATVRALVDLLKVPSSSQPFDAQHIEVDPGFPLQTGCSTTVWRLGWSVVWHVVQRCMGNTVQPELMEGLVATFGNWRTSHGYLFTPMQQTIYIQLFFVLLTEPAFYLESTPLQAAHAPVVDASSIDGAVAEAVQWYVREWRERRPGIECETSEDLAVLSFAEKSPASLWNFELRRRPKSGQLYGKASVPVRSFVEANSSRSLEVRSVAALISGAESEMKTSHLPSHRTMLHVSSCKLTHTQSALFSMLEDMQSFSEPFVEVLFIHQLCAVFLDVRLVLKDTNRFALAGRALILLIIFTRRVVLANLRKGVSESSVEMLLASIPHVLRIVTQLSCSEGSKIRESGLWKLAMEALVYLIEDTVPAVAHVARSEVKDAYWKAVAQSLAEVVGKVLISQHGSNPAAEIVLAEVIGNLVVHRLLVSPEAPSWVAERTVRVLVDLAGLSEDTSALSLEGVSSKGSTELSTPLALGHLFHLCACSDREAAARIGDGGLEDDGEQNVQSVASMTAGGQRAQRFGQLTHPAIIVSIAAPAVLALVRSVLSSYIQAETLGTPLTRRRTTELQEVLSHIEALRVGPSFSRAASLSEQAEAACFLAGARGCTMILFPQLAALTSTRDAQVRSRVQRLLQELASELGLGL